MARAARRTPEQPAAAKPPRSRPRVDREARRADYLRAAARIFLANGPQASMQDVSDAAGAPKPVFYRIFPSRADLIDALYQHVHDVVIEAQKGEWDGYGWALKALYLEARKEPEIFLAALKTFRGDPTVEPWRQKLLDLVYRQTMRAFQPGEGAPAGAARRAARAGRTINSLFFDTLVSWLEDADGLTDEARFRWWGRVVREWRKATREAFELDAPAAPQRP